MPINLLRRLVTYFKSEEVMIIPIVVVVFVVGAGIALFVMNSKSQTKVSPEEQKASEFSQRLMYLLKIVVEHSDEAKRQSSEKEVIRIGEEVNTSGGFRLMIQTHKKVTSLTSEKYGSRLNSLWKGIGDWRGR